MEKIDVLDKGFVRLVDHMGDDAAIVQAARVSYGTGTKTVSDDETLIRYMMRNHHTSVFEQVCFKFHIKAPIFVYRQWHRHRTWSYNEISGRYSKLSDECYVPDEDKVTFQNPTNKQGGSDEKMTVYNVKNPDDWWDCLTPEQIEDNWSWGEHFKNEQEMVHKSYERWVNSGVRKELARINLPVAQYSEMYATVDLHNLFHFLRLRMDAHAQWEIRQYANALFELIKPIVPISCAAFEDYILNAVTLSQKDIKCFIGLLNLLDENTISDMIQVTEDNNSLIQEVFSNKRERKEFVDKLKKFL